MTKQINTEEKLKDLSENELDAIKQDLQVCSKQLFLLRHSNFSEKNYYFMLKKFAIVPAKHRFSTFTNGVKDISLSDDMPIPDGFHPGRTHKNVKTTKDYFWITDGNENHLIKVGDTIPEGFKKGNSGKKTSGYTIWNNGVVQTSVAPGMTPPEGFVKGKLPENEKCLLEASKRRKKGYFNNGEREIHVLLTEPIPEGFVPGRLTLDARIVSETKKLRNEGYIPLNELSVKQRTAYQHYRDLNMVDDKVILRCKTYVNKRYLSMFDEYAKTNHSKGTSNAEKSVVDFIKTFYKGKIETNVKSVLKDDEGNYFELDIYIPEKHVAIEYNGNFWHSSENKPKNYHLIKSKLCEKAGIRLIHLYEYEWLDNQLNPKIKMMLKSSLGCVETRIYARKCTVKEISNKEARVLNNAIHLQGHRNAQVTLGLFYNNELVQLMSFSRTKYNRNLEEGYWEIIRGCPGSNSMVIGGVSKLFKYFVKHYNPKGVFSYCDFNKFNGSSYAELGMKFIGYTGPDMKWLMPDGTVVNRNPSKHNELKKMAKYQIFGSGSKKYLWTNNS